MDTDKLKYFVTIAETGSLTKAAQILSISHSGLSKAVGSLEAETRLKLFRPQGRGLEITPEGKWFYLKAREILKIADEVSAGVKTERPMIRIGVSGVIAMTCASALAQELAVPVALSEIDVGEVESKIIGGELDFGLAFIPLPKPELEYLELGEVLFGSHAHADLLARVAPADLPFAVPLSEFPANPLGYRNRDGWPQDVPRKPYFAVSSFSIALDLLRGASAAIYMPEYVATLENARGGKILAVKEHREAQTKRKLFLVKRQASEETREMKRASKVVRRVCCKLAP